MNNLSLFLYLADVIYQVGGLLTAVCVFVPIGYLAYRLACKIWADNSHHSRRDEIRALAEAEILRPFITTYKPFIFAFVGIFLLSLVPSKETFYLIAASEAGEMVVKTPEAQEIMSSLREILNVQLEELKK